MSNITPLARSVDIVSNEDGPYRVYSYGITTTYCADIGQARFVDDVFVSPDIDPSGSGGIFPTYFITPPCIRSAWETDYEVIDYDLGNGIFTKINKEIELVFEDMTECHPEHKDCESVTLTFSLAENKWLGDFTWNTGKNGANVPYEFYGFSVFNPETEAYDIFWVLHSLGCFVSEEGGIGVGEDPTPDGIFQFMTIICPAPLVWETIDEAQPYGYYNCCCNTPYSPPVIRIYNKLEPVTLGRFVDRFDGTSVYHVDDVICECPCNDSCCGGVPFDDLTEYTIFDFVITSTIGPFPENCGDCGAIQVADGGPPFVSGDSPPIRSCRTLYFEPGCFTGVSICVFCSPNGCASEGSGSAEPSQRWQYYRTYMQVTLPLPFPPDYDVVREPEFGSCDPFSVTFTEIPFKVETSGAFCFGTFSMTVTREACA